MKYIFLAFFVLLAAQPVQASPCDMQSPQETVHGDSHDMNHDDSMDMDCCDPDSPDSSENCDSMSRCNAGTTSAVAFSSYTINTVPAAGTRLLLTDAGGPLNRFSPPPLRPPIS